MVYRFVKVKELADHGTVADVFGYGAEAVILGDARHIVLAVVLPQGLGVPCDALPHIAAVDAGLVHNLVERGAYSDEFFFFLHVFNKILVLPTPCRQADQTWAQSYGRTAKTLIRKTMQNGAKETDKQENAAERVISALSITFPLKYLRTVPLLFLFVA